MRTTRSSPSTKTASIAYRMKNMWIDGDRSIQRPSPGPTAEVPSSPTVRSRMELAIRQCSARVVPRVGFVTRTQVVATDQLSSDEMGSAGSRTRTTVPSSSPPSRVIDPPIASISPRAA